jgi:hypothetical protein
MIVWLSISAVSYIALFDFAKSPSDFLDHITFLYIVIYVTGKRKVSVLLCGHVSFCGSVPSLQHSTSDTKL